MDIDGTLTEPGYNDPPASALDAIRRAQKNGHRVFLCSGRNRAMLGPFLRYGFDGYVASAGGYVVCGDEIVVDRPMDHGLFLSAMECFGRNHVFRTIETRDGSYGDVDPVGDGGERYSNAALLSYRSRLSRTLDIRPIGEYDGARVYKIVLMCTDKRQFDEPMALLGDRLNFCIQNIDAKPYINGEVFEPDHDKGTGILRICEACGAQIEDTIGFGDSMNDREMFETVGYSVCMGNGHPEMKEIADHVCHPVENDGLYREFAKLGLI